MMHSRFRRMPDRIRYSKPGPGCGLRRRTAFRFSVLARLAACTTQLDITATAYCSRPSRHPLFEILSRRVRQRSRSMPTLLSDFGGSDKLSTHVSNLRGDKNAKESSTHIRTSDFDSGND